MQGNFRYRAVPGLFDIRIPNIGSQVPPRLGLINDSANRWIKLRTFIEELNATAGFNTSFKVVFFIRHGEAIHDLGKSKYGHEAWDTYWSLLDGDGELIWGRDPALTAAGRAHATAIHEIWTTEVQAGLLLPERLYCSPLRRAMETNHIIFGSLLPVDQRTTIVDRCRRLRGGHTCDRRRSRAEILTSFPASEVEAAFTEHDELWQLDGVDTPAGAAAQAQIILDNIFSDPATHISVTAHGRIIAAFLRNPGVCADVLPTGGVYPVLIEAVASIAETSDAVEIP
ncbi:histidine phosphatase superfamily [Mycena vulgaris]|nr:histidine phosphatase superfamily [Mycena vulgaris]